MYRVETSERALASIRELDERLATFAHGTDVAKVLTRIAEAIIALAEHPTRHRLLHPPAPAFPRLRCADAGKYVVFFTVDDARQLVEVIDVQHGRRGRGRLRAAG